MTVDPDDARGFSTNILEYEACAPMDFGTIELALPAGDTCELNAFHPSCLTGDRFWQPHFLGDQDFVPTLDEASRQHVAVHLVVVDHQNPCHL